ncbi:hypothetical protein QVD99_004525 [Batrachochytrium dendrobatidis]|nr:hypothetical protein O5D80_002761 [Batrachochytrium dendrobatidis]KAK5668729.1 hypothetical protein QVD99_004525 [Batrachochytrium dendrobatidis]
MADPYYSSNRSRSPSDSNSRSRSRPRRNINPQPSGLSAASTGLALDIPTGSSSDKQSGYIRDRSGGDNPRLPNRALSPNLSGTSQSRSTSNSNANHSDYYRNPDAGIYMKRPPESTEGSANLPSTSTTSGITRSRDDLSYSSKTPTDRAKATLFNPQYNNSAPSINTSASLQSTTTSSKTDRSLSRGLSTESAPAYNNRSERGESSKDLRSSDQIDTRDRSAKSPDLSSIRDRSMRRIDRDRSGPISSNSITTSTAQAKSDDREPLSSTLSSSSSRKSPLLMRPAASNNSGSSVGLDSRNAMRPSGSTGRAAVSSNSTPDAFDSMLRDLDDIDSHGPPPTSSRVAISSSSNARRAVGPDYDRLSQSIDRLMESPALSNGNAARADRSAVSSGGARSVDRLNDRNTSSTAIMDSRRKTDFDSDKNSGSAGSPGSTTPDRSPMSPRGSSATSTSFSSAGRTDRRLRDNMRSPPPLRTDGSSSLRAENRQRSGSDPNLNVADPNERRGLSRSRVVDRDRESPRPSYRSAQNRPEDIDSSPATDRDSASQRANRFAGRPSSPSTAQPDSDKGQDSVMQEKERKEMERQRRELENLKSEQREADRQELVRVAAERQKRIQADRERRGSDTREFMLLSRSPINEALVVSDYIRALISTLRSDPTVTPIPDDFTSPDAYQSWRMNMNVSLQKVLVNVLKLRFLKPQGKPGEVPQTEIKLFFKVVQACGLIAKEGRSRDAYCSIEFGDLSGRKKSKHAPETTIWKTEVVQGTTNPTWNQHLNFDVHNLTDKIHVEVWDSLKDQFLGIAKVNISDVITRSAREGYISMWIRLEPRDAKNKDKYVGGKILLEAAIDKDDNNRRPNGGQPDKPQTFEQFQQHLNSCRLSGKALYRTLLRSSLLLDLHSNQNNQPPNSGVGPPPPQSDQDVLSEESVTMLRILSRVWGVGESVQVMLYMQLLLEKYKTDQVPVTEILKAFEILFANVKREGWVPTPEHPMFVGLLQDLQDHFQTQVTKYKEFFPKNRPARALETSILILRMIQKSPLFRQAHPEMHASFREELRQMLLEALIVKFQRFREHTAPLDDSDVESVVEGINRLAELVSEEIEIDNKYFQSSFSNELDIVRLTAENHLKYFVLTLEDASELLASQNAVESASKLVFELYKKVKVMHERYAKLVPGLKSLSINAGFNAERWFSPFMMKWLDKLQDKTVEWVSNAVKADTFEPNDGATEDGFPPHSSSVTDIFSAIYSELEFITDLGWSDPLENAVFFQSFAKTVNKAIEQYCDAIAIGELKRASDGPTTAAGAMNAFALNLLGGRSTAPKDIQHDSCVKLRNIEYAMSKLRDMYRMMNVAAITKTVSDHRKSMAPTRRGGKNPLAAIAGAGAKTPTAAGDQEELITGAFKIHASFAENIKPINKYGMSSPYIIVRVPEGTVVPPPALDTSALKTTRSKSQNSPSNQESAPPTPPAPTTLTGSSCELLRTRVIQDTVNPTWDETFQIIFPPISQLEIQCWSRNLITFDELIGTALIDLSSRTRLRRKLVDNQTHDIFVELEPQGRLLLRLTMEGEQEDVAFWFRRTNERLIRTRDDFLRSVVAKISPYIKEVISKALKDLEAVPVKAGFFSSLTTAVQYSNLTAAGASIDTSVTELDTDVYLAPLMDYLNKNLEILCSLLSPPMAQEVIKRAWEDALVVIESVLVPGLYGQIESTRRVLNRRQVSLLKWSLSILRDFFHADGQGMGLPMSVLDTRKYVDISHLNECYFNELTVLKREYEVSANSGRDCGLILRLIRFRFERDEGANASVSGWRDEGKAWVDDQLMKQREMSRK